MPAMRALLLAALLSCTLRGTRAARTRHLTGLFDWIPGFGGNDEDPAPAPTQADPSYVRPIQAYNPMTATTAYVLQYVLASAVESSRVPEQTVNFTAPSVAASGAVDLFSPYEGDVVLVFKTDSGALLDGPGTEPKRVPFLQPFVYTAEGPAPLVDAFSVLLSPTDTTTGEGPLADAVEAAMGGKAQELFRVVCTGADPGGMELAVLCGPWAALMYPRANVDVITFGDAWSAAYNVPFSWTFQQLVTLHYLWPFNLEDITPNSSIADPLLAMAGAVNPLITTESVAQAIEVPNMPDWVPRGSTGWDPEDELGELGPAPDLAEELKLPESDCPVILCKTRNALELSCLGFGQSANVLEDLPHIDMKDPVTDGDAIVAWNESSSTLYLLFKYTEERQDWLINAQGFQTSEFTNSIASFTQAPPGDRLEDIIPDVEVHRGFFRQFRSLAIDPVEEGGESCVAEGIPLSKLLQAACNLTGGVEPLRVVSSGFSLGAALSELGGVWASHLWPGSNIMVTNQGGPTVGDDNFVKLAQATFGRAYKYVYQLDEVPSIPPLPDYQQTQSSLWIMEGSVLLQDRPGLELWETNWNDHTCDTWTNPDTGELVIGYVPRLMNATRVVVPSWVFGAATAR